MDHVSRWSIIAQVTSWIQLSGIALAGQPRETRTPIKIERNTENNSISRSHSTTEFWSRALASCATRTWPMSHATWEWPGSVEKNWITKDSKKLEEDMKTASRLTLMMPKNESLEMHIEILKHLTRSRHINECSRGYYDLSWFKYVRKSHEWGSRVKSNISFQSLL